MFQQKKKKLYPFVSAKASEPSLARSVHKPLKVPSLARSVPKPLKVLSLARSVLFPEICSIFLEMW